MEILKADVEGRSSSKYSPPIQEEERQEKTTFTVLQKKKHEVDGFEIYRVRWDVITDLRNMAPRQRDLGN